MLVPLPPTLQPDESSSLVEPVSDPELPPPSVPPPMPPPEPVVPGHPADVVPGHPADVAPGQPADVVPGQPADVPVAGHPAEVPVPGHPADVPVAGHPAEVPVPGHPADVVPGQPALVSPPCIGVSTDCNPAGLACARPAVPSTAVAAANSKIAVSFFFIAASLPRSLREGGLG